MDRTVLVVGATGVTGRSVIEEARRTGVDVVGLARRVPRDAPVPFVAADLLDADASRGAMARLSNVTHLVHCGFVPGPTFLDQVAPNRAILANALAGLAAARAPLERVVLVQGMKYYGSHLGPFRTPAREDDPRHMPPNYYYEQQDLLADEANRAGFTYACLRPHVIWGVSPNTPQNILAVIAAWAAFCRASALPLTFPGTSAAFEALQSATDARLLARAVLWAAFEPACANEAYNINNGDTFRWCNAWPAIAKAFALEPGGVRTLDLAAHMGGQGEWWGEIARRESLTTARMEDAVNWTFADYIWRAGWDVVASTLKARRDGFADFCDTEAMMRELIARMQREGLAPGPSPA